LSRVREAGAVAAEFTDSDDLREARFTAVNLSGARFRAVDMSGVKMVDTLLVGADLSGLIIGLRVNGVEVAPLIGAELDRLHPERVQLRPRDAAGMVTACDTLDAMWAPTMERVRRLPEPALHERVDEEWSFLETLRHLVFVVDSWVSHAGLGEAKPYSAIGVVPSFLGDPTPYGIDPDADPDLDDVLAVRADRLGLVRRLAETLTDAELEDRGPDPKEPGYPPDTDHSMGECLRVVFDEEWCHHQYAIRDLAVLESR
jgi:hypothetical protein